MKTILKSKTFWIFFLLLIVSSLNTLGITNLPISENADWLIAAISIIAILLRIITKEPINWDSGFKCLLLLLLFFSFIPSNASAQTLILKDSITYGDSVAVFNTSSYTDLYFDLYNIGSDSSITVYLFTVTPNNNSFLTGFIDLAGSNDYTLITSVELAPNTGKRFKVFGNHYNLKFLFSPSEGPNTRIDIIVEAFNKLHF